MNAEVEAAKIADVKETEKVVEAEVFNNNLQEQEADF